MSIEQQVLRACALPRASLRMTGSRLVMRKEEGKNRGFIFDAVNTYSCAKVEHVAAEEQRPGVSPLNSNPDLTATGMLAISRS